MAVFTSEEDAICKLPDLEFGPTDMTVEFFIIHFECVNFFEIDWIFYNYLIERGCIQTWEWFTQFQFFAGSDDRSARCHPNSPALVVSHMWAQCKRWFDQNRIFTRLMNSFLRFLHGAGFTTMKAMYFWRSLFSWTMQSSIHIFRQ
jgi:hypothetical protein